MSLVKLLIWPLLLLAGSAQTAYGFKDGYGLDVSSWQVVDEGHSSKKSRSYGKGSFKMRILVEEALSLKKANFLLRLKRSAMERSYEPIKSPYPGQISEVVHCEKDLYYRRYTVRWSGEELPLHAGAMTVRKQWGACKTVEVRYLGATVSRYFPRKKQLVTIRIIERRQPNKGIGESFLRLKKAIGKVLKYED